MNAINIGKPSNVPLEIPFVSPEVESEPLSLRLNQAVANSQTLQDLLNHLARIIHDQSDCLSLWLSMPNEAGEFQTFRPVPGREGDPMWTVVEDLTRSITPQVVQTGAQQHSAFQANAQLIVSPIGQTRSAEQFHAVGVLVGCFSTENQSAVRQNWLMSMVSQAMVAWFAARSFANSESRVKHLNEVLTTLVSLSRTDNLPQTCLVLCNQLRKQFSADLVAVSLSQGKGSFSLTAISDVEQIDHASDWTINIAKACAVGGKAVEPVAFPSTEETPSEGMNTLQQFCGMQNAEACISLPLVREDGTVCASVLVVADADRIQDPGTVEHFTKVTQMLGTHVDVVTRANRGASQWAADKLRQLKAANWTRNALLGSGVLALVMSLPLPYRISCDCTITPVKRRFLAAPYDGILDRTSAKLGDVVAADDVVARMDEGNLRIELSGVQAELSAARKRRDSALALGEVAQSQIANSEMRRHQSRVDLLSERLRHLEIRSPIDGLIVAGDLEKAEGAPLQMGQTVFEVAPLDQMLVEVAIEESEIGYARVGMPVDIKLNAFPFRSWDGVVKSISPSTEIVSDKATFIAEVELSNKEMKLRPGMEGTAKIRADRACLGWSLFHRPWESVRYWTVW